jgi:hypothetical protein
MIWNDLKKLLSGPTLFRLDAVLGARLVPILYLLGLVAIALWAIEHLFASFAYNFGQGLWGILEIIVYGPLWLVVLRIACDVLLVFFKAHEASAAAASRARGGNSLLEDVGDAIHDLAGDDNDVVASATDSTPMMTGALVAEGGIWRGSLRRTAKRTPPLRS